jgi:lipid A 3-O-deacylase
VITTFRHIGNACAWALTAALSLGIISSGTAAAQASQPTPTTTPLRPDPEHHPLEYGLIVQGGTGVTDNRDGFKFLMAGVHAGKVLTGNLGPGPLRGNFEYAIEVFPFWQSYTPKFQRANCTAVPGSQILSCSPLYTVGGTFTGASIVPIILRWNFAGTGRFAPWIQGAGGVIWTNHKYPSFGSPVLNLGNDGPNTDASVWNFSPQFGVGVHYFIHPNRSIDFSANGVHISSASLGDKNPGVNSSIHFSLGYSWWK